jgi:hypothetical protein
MPGECATLLIGLLCEQKWHRDSATESINTACSSLVLRVSPTYKRHRLTILVGHVLVNMQEYACVPNVTTLYTTCLYNAMDNFAACTPLQT